MSDNWIIVIPEAADHVPSPDARRKAVELFRSIAPRADEVKEEASEKVRFIDCGANLERTLCPVCGAELEMEWWREKMDEEADAGFPLRSITLPCCSAQKSLDQLTYDWPQGFARFSVEAMNPDIPDLTDEQMRAFESVLGCRVRKVLQHI
jgi:hypothetical protein